MNIKLVFIYIYIHKEVRNVNNYKHWCGQRSLKTGKFLL